MSAAELERLARSVLTCAPLNCRAERDCFALARSVLSLLAADAAPAASASAPDAGAEPPVIAIPFGWETSTGGWAP